MKKFEFSDNYFDVIHANQIIEHITNVDIFVAETYRILKTGGYVIISTENLSVVDNVIALFSGQQAFSQHISERYHIGNIFSPHYGERLGKWRTHKIVFSYFGIGIQQLLKAYNFKIDKVAAAGFFPFPNFLSKFDRLILAL